MSMRWEIAFLGLIVTTFFLAALYEFADSDKYVPHEFVSGLLVHSDKRRWQFTTHLDTNPNEKIRLVVKDLCKLEGEAQLVILAAAASREESFVFFPDLCLWIEVGQHETSSSVSLDIPFLETLRNYRGPVILYHIHIGSPRSAKAYFPAYSDLIILVMWHAAKDSKAAYETQHKAATSIGIFTYSLASNEKVRRLVNNIRRSGLGQYVEQNLAYEYMRGSHESNYYRAVKKCGVQSDDNPKKIKLCFPIRVDDFLIEFETIGPKPMPKNCSPQELHTPDLDGRRNCRT
jgi:hypothetical protein